MMEFSKKLAFSKKDDRQRTILKTFHHFHKLHTFDTSDFTTAVQESLSHFAPFAPGSISVPRMHFWAQKCISGTKMLPGEKGAIFLLTCLHRCSEIRRVKNEIFVKNLKNISEFCVVEILFYGISHFWKIQHKNHTFGVLRQTLLKQRRNGAILDENPPNPLFPPKTHFGPKNAFWDQHAFWSKK